MPHVFSNRRRLLNLTADDTELRAQFRWETINAIAYKLGGVLFVLGSYFFFPSQAEHAYIGSWLFLAASLVYLVVNVHDMAEIRRYWKSHPSHSLDELLEYLAGACYLTGTLCFFFGRVVAFPVLGMELLSTWLFIIGSLLFIIGAASNVLLIVKADSVQLLQLMNLTSITFIVGSVLYGTASVPYLWAFESPNDHLLILNFLAWQYMIGSVLFLLGGVFNYWRAFVLVQRKIEKLQSLEQAAQS
ncbi:YrhK family protein [uncultured Vibrio sp.]|uniref:YrhK family protein n=1 Tax=uncultured Vibrio sp. TaxID=114054 RepID=UPI002608AAE6|nr:YrhK family protein [uncultured Vibrio sp.]